MNLTGASQSQRPASGLLIQSAAITKLHIFLIKPTCLPTMADPWFAGHGRIKWPRRSSFKKPYKWADYHLEKYPLKLSTPKLKNS